MFDITTKRAVESGDIQLKDGNGVPMVDDKANPVTVTVYSPASKEWEAAHADMQRARADRLQKAGNRYSGALQGAKEEQINFLCRVTISLGFKVGGKEGPEAVRALYEDDKLGFIRDQVYAEVNDWSAFTGGSAKS